ncbi:hypothetical protein IEQ34_025582 [Dendrobium chrysotoxum]|uniref:Uncharacterized protein n=1 Tax=Dendrobium chrysotoxum TaxID=161865 RepID=A0AAV7FPK5_DENCH|nr:hypothetical protein IEQ34_025582 [Dendrobium chrysotoxum]
MGLNEAEVNRGAIVKKFRPRARGRNFYSRISLSILDGIWRHGQVVRRGTANPLSPVRIWVSPDQQKKTWNFLILLIELYEFLPRKSIGKG